MDQLAFGLGGGHDGLAFDAEGSHERRFRMRLKGLARGAVDVDNNAFGVAGEVDADVDVDLCKFFGDFSVFLRLGLLNVGFEFAGDGGDFIEKGEFPLVEGAVNAGEAGDEVVHYFVEGRFHWIRLRDAKVSNH